MMLKLPRHHRGAGHVAIISPARGATYSTNYTSLAWEWRLAHGVVDGAPVIVHWRRDGDAWRAHAAIRLWWSDGVVVRIRDYIHVEYLLADVDLLSGFVGSSAG